MLLDDNVSTIPMVGKTYADRLSRLRVHTIRDLIWYLPRAYDDMREVQTIETAVIGEKSVFRGQIGPLTSIRTRNGKTLTKGLFTDDSGSIEVVWFNQPYLKTTLQKDEELYLSGKIKQFGAKRTLQSPAFEKVGKTQIHTGRLVPIYPQTEGLSSKWLRHKLHLVLRLIEQIPEYHEPSFLKTHKLLSIQEALRAVHFPENPDFLEQAKRRLGFDELFFIQLRNLRQKLHTKRHGNAHSLKCYKENLSKTIKSLPFELTNAQRLSLFEILDDMKQSEPMHRLLEGDVGSGKTIVAGLSMLNALWNNAQTALMAPTSILASQHFQKLFKLLTDHGANTALLLGSTPKKEKDHIKQGLANGTIDCVIGTHALVQDDIAFQKLGLVVIDEQHRFGVNQRKSLNDKGSPHILNMTATPIPRTIALTIFGNQDLSIIDELPKGRQKITTKIVPKAKQTLAYQFIDKHLEEGRQAFVVCPLIEDSEKMDAKSVEQMQKELAEIFPHRSIGTLHGKMKASEKEHVMSDLKEKKYDILISTSVVEVGIDIPNASIMMIQGAERFGLAQLHQFRGRVGRGPHKSFCLLFSDHLSQNVQTRLKAMEEISDGFELAKIDLSIRGPGEVFGTRQSGVPDLRMANLTDQKLLHETHQAASILLKEDPELKNHQDLLEACTEFTNRYLYD